MDDWNALIDIYVFEALSSKLNTVKINQINHKTLGIGQLLIQKQLIEKIFSMLLSKNL